MRKIVLVVFASLVIAAGAAYSVAQTAGVSVSTVELRDVAAGWSAKKQILGKDVYNDTGDKVGEINDLIVTPAKAVSYAIVGVGGFLGMGEHEIAVPVGKLKQEQGKIVLHGATKEALKAAPKFEYARSSRRSRGAQRAPGRHASRSRGAAVYAGMVGQARARSMPAPEGYMLSVVCSCGVTCLRWVTPEAAAEELRQPAGARERP